MGEYRFYLVRYFVLYIYYISDKITHTMTYIILYI